MKRILEEPKPESNINFIPNTEPKIEWETIDNVSEFNTLNIYIIGATLLV